jgi:transcriptional regulator with XRE-family HTH domain
MEQILKSIELKNLRQSRGVSQAQLARDVGIQRSYISQFENGKYLFEDTELTSIRAYLESMEDLNEFSGASSEEVRLDSVIRDGLLIPGGLDADQIELGFDGLHTSLAMFREACDLSVPKGFFGVDEEELQSLQLDAGLIAIRALQHIFALQGRELFDAEQDNKIGGSLLELI